MKSKGFHISREKVALVMFALIVLAGLALACSYFFMGRQLNTTAVVVDDVTGKMQDYSLVVFSGTGDESDQDEIRAIEAKKGDDVYASGLGHDAATALKERFADAYLRANVNRSLWKDHVFASDVRNDYELKGADVVTIDLSNLAKYSRPVIIDSGKNKFGVFSIKKYTSKARLKSIVSSLRSKGADDVVCIAKDASMLSSYNGLNAVVSLSPISDDDASSAYGATLLVEMPKKGSVGVLLFSRTNVVSYKTVNAL